MFCSYEEEYQGKIYVLTNNGSWSIYESIS